MRIAVTHLLMTLALVASAAAAPQEMRRVTEPTPLEASDPLAVRSAALVKHLLAGDKEAAVALLKKDGAEAYVNGGKLEADVDAQIKRLSAAKYTITEYHKGIGADVVVLMAGDKGEDANIVIRYNGDHKYAGFAQAKISR